MSLYIVGTSVHWSGQSASFSQTTSTSPGKAKKGAASVVAQTRASTQTNYFVNPINEMGPGNYFHPFITMRVLM